MWLFNKKQKGQVEVDKIDLAISLFSTIMMGGYPTANSVDPKLVEELQLQLSTREEVLLKVIELCGEPKSPRELYIISKAYVWAGAKYRQEAIKYLKLYLGGEEWEALPNTNLTRYGYTVNQKTIEKSNLLVELGKCYEGEYEFDKALECYLKSQEIYPIMPTGILRGVEIYRKMNKLDEGISYLEHVRKSEYYKLYEWENYLGEIESDDTFRIAIDMKIEELNQKKQIGYTYRPRKNRKGKK